MNEGKKGKLLLALFDAEAKWDGQDLATLPHIQHPYYQKIVGAMEELLIAMAQPEDWLVSQTREDESYIKYLAALGFKANRCTYETMEEAFSGCQEIFAYADIYDYYELAEKEKLTYKRPPYEVIRKVNSKIYSVELARKTGMNDYSYIVRDIDELKTRSKELIKQGKMIMIKEDYGVSGKGNRAITKEKELELILKTVERQKKEIAFIIEPLWDVAKDFSSQYYIDEKGKATWISTQEIWNQNGSYMGAINMSEKDIDGIRQKGYFKQLDQIADQLYKEGYYGHVCFDSMILTDGRLIPVVEINARCSMSLIKHNIDQKIGLGDARKGCMFYREFSYESNLSYEKLCGKLGEKGLLYGESEEGFIPFTCQTLFANRQVSEKLSRGRMYFYATFQSLKLLERQIFSLEELLTMTNKGRMNV